MKLANLEFIKPGSAKDIYRVDEKDIAFRFTDFFSVFDVGRADYGIPGKAKALCTCAVKSFQIAEKIGVPTHFVEQLDDVTIRVREAQIITDRFLTEKDENYVVPAELIYRLRVAGSIERDFQSGKKKPENYGLPAGKIPATGTPFPYPVHMTTTKFEDTDREITLEEACQMAGITLKDLSEYWSMIDRLTGAAELHLSSNNFALLDGKTEVLMGPGRQKMIGDVFITPDEDRFCPKDLLKKGEVKHFSKEFLRQIFIDNGYYARLQEVRARKDGSPDPPIPRITDEQLAEVSFRYKTAAAMYAGLDNLPWQCDQ